MPLRLLREGILTSDRVDKLAAADEVFYRRLMSVVDDFGRFDGRPAILRTSLYPLRVERVREADIVRSLACCQEAGLIRLYSVDGKPYLEILDFRQQVRAKVSKYPDPPPAEQAHSSCTAVAQQLLAVAHLDGDGDGDGDEGGTPKPPRGDSDQTERFLEAIWKEGPPQTRLRSSKKQLQDAWARTKPKPDMREVFRVLKLWANCEAWTKDNGQFAQAIHRWVQLRQWENIPEASKTTTPKPNRCT